MSAREVQIVLARVGYCEEATSLALLHALDLDVVFDLLVDKYLSALVAEQEYVKDSQSSGQLSMMCIELENIRKC